jgi:dTDP-4-dehydrorhamnose reductase
MRVLVTGSRGMLAQAVRAELARRGHDVVAPDESGLDVTRSEVVDRVVDEVAPDAVVQCAAYTAVDRAEEHEEEATRVNADGTAIVAHACRRVGARFVYPSTDYVFDGTADRPYPPDARPSPLNAYGRSKLAGEVAAREADRAFIVRTSWLYGAGGPNFVSAILKKARAGERLRVVADQQGAPTWTADLARVFLDLLERDAAPGIYHATNGGQTTWHGFAREALRLAGLPADVDAISTEDMPRPAARPRYSVLDCSATEAIVGPMRPWQDALEAALAEGL